MSIPIISTNIITSIREQVHRGANFGEPYYMMALKEIEHENLNLYEAITNTVKDNAEKLELNIANDKDLLIIANMYNIAISVYMAIKQQMIVNELESNE